MKKSIEKLREKIKSLNTEKQYVLDALQLEYDAVFDDCLELKKNIDALENSSDYTTDGCGEICCYIDLTLDIEPNEVEFLREYLSKNHCIHLDVDNDTLLRWEGSDCIVINHEGDIFSGHNLLINKSEYETELKRNILIEKYMEKTGCYPGVFTQDYHGNVFPVSTVSPFSEYKESEKHSYVVGVVGGNSVDWDDDFSDSIDIGFESYLVEREHETRLELESEGKTEEEIEEEIESRRDDWGDDYCSDGTTYLFGDWKKDTDGKYEIDTEGSQGFSATYNSNDNTICVEFSRTIMTCHHTSPCYRMVDGRPCGDLDTEGDSCKAYSLPIDYFK